jgi:hypothetical protein
MVREDLTEPLVTQDGDIPRGEKQSAKCRDWPFALLFCIHLTSIISTALALGIPALNDSSDWTDDDGDDDTDYTGDYQGFMYLSLLCAGMAFGLSFLSLSLMMAFPQRIITYSLWISVAMNFILGFIFLAAGEILMGLLCLFFFALSLCYVIMVKKRIPFAAANLATGVRAVRQNCGLTFVAYFITLASVGYTALWCLALAGVFSKTVDQDEVDDCKADCNGDSVCEDDCDRYPNIIILFFLFIAYFWTQQVATNTIHVTVAGTVGTWWVSPDEANHFCSKALKDSFVRATTLSFGSICFGSLLVAIVQALRQLIRAAQQNDDGNQILLCICDCLLQMIENLLTYFNKWAYVYVGIYGYSYLEGAKAVMQLFEARGWSVIISDDLVQNSLMLVCVMIGLCTGLLGLALSTVPEWFPEDKDINYVGFGVGFLVGYILAMIMLGVVESAVNSVLVLFAEAPYEFSQNYPELSEEMRAAWRKTHPSLCSF